MSVVILILGLALLSGVAVGWELVQLGRHAPEVDLHTRATRVREESYSPMGRLFAPQDLTLVAHRRDLADKLLKDRRRAMRLFLAQLREDYCRTWTICRLLTPVSNDPNFTYLLVRQAVVFHLLYILAYARCGWGFRAPVEVDFGSLVDSFIQLNRQAAQLLRAPDQLPAAA